MALSGTFFNATYYLTQYSDVAANWSGSALSHYEAYGATEGRAPNSWFDYQYYRATYSDLQTMTALELFAHYEAYGYAEGRVPDSAYADFDEAQYLADYSDLGAAGITEDTALNHYLTYGADEGRIAYDDAANVITDSTDSTGQSFTLTTSIDALTGTTGDDTFIGDNSGALANNTISNGDQITGGAGNDILKAYYGTTDVGLLTLPTMTSVETLYINGGDFGTGNNEDYSSLTGVEEIQFDSTTVNGGAAGTFTITTGTDQSLSFTGINVATGTTGVLELKGGSSITLNAVGTSETDDGIVTIDVAGTQTDLALTGETAESEVTVSNTGTKLTTLTLAGDQDLTITESIAGVKTIDASDATGDMTVDKSGAAAAAAFTFTGGSGDDALVLRAGDLAALTSADQLDGGDGDTDALIVSETAVLTTAQVADINDTVGFEVLGFAANGSGVDISELDSINTFFVEDAITTSVTFTNANDDSVFEINNTAGSISTVSISNATGENTTTIAIDNQSGATQTLGSLALSGITTVNLSSTGKTGSANVITTLTNEDNSKFTITGDRDLDMGTIAATTTGSKVDAQDFTGDLTVTSSGQDDILIGGSGDDTFTLAAGGSVKLTGGDGDDGFDVSLAVYGAGGEITTITDLSTDDTITFADGGGTNAFNATEVDLSGAGTLAAALDALAVTAVVATNTTVRWGEYDGNTYIAADVSTQTTLQTADVVVKLSGSVDLSGYATADFAFV